MGFERLIFAREVFGRAPPGRRAPRYGAACRRWACASFVIATARDSAGFVIFDDQSEGGAMLSRRIASLTGWYIGAAFILCAATARGGQPASVNPATNEALTLCREADQVSVADRSTVLVRGLDRAEEAVRAYPRDPVAHFAVFCNLGKRLQMKQRGAGFFATLGELGRVQKEIDVALALAPDYAAALAAKGEMLVELPRILGGDPQAGERLLRRAVTLDPEIRTRASCWRTSCGTPATAIRRSRTPRSRSASSSTRDLRTSSRTRVASLPACAERTRAFRRADLPRRAAPRNETSNSFRAMTSTRNPTISPRAGLDGGDGDGFPDG